MENHDIRPTNRHTRQLTSYREEWTGNLSGDIKGGISSGIITLPIALAFGQASGLGAMAGLYGAVILGLVGTILGGTKTQISSPVGVVLVTVIFIVNFQLEASSDLLNLSVDSSVVLAHALPFMFLTFFLAGIFQLIFGVLKLGAYIQYLPYPVVSGFSTGIGLLIIFLQIQDLAGFQFPAHAEFVLSQLLDPQYIASLEIRTVLAAAAILTTLLFPRITNKIPGSLMAIVLISALPYLVGWSDFRTVNMPLEKGISLNFSILSTLTDVQGIIRSVGYAFSLAMISSINALLTSLAADHMTTDRHQSNRELIGQGIGNTVVSLFGGMPGSGAIACTVNNIQQGGRTRLSGMVSTLTLVIFLLFAGGLISKIPVPVLDGILIYVGYLIIDKKAIRHIKAMPVMDTIILITVAILTAYGELLYAVVIGLAMASIYFMKKMADVVELDTRYAKVDRLVDNLISTFDDEEDFRRKVYIKNIKGPVFFGFASRFSKSLRLTSETKAVILNFGDVPYVDQSGLYTLEREVLKIRQKGIIVFFTELNPRMKLLLESIDLIPQLISSDHLFPSVEECIIWLKEPGNLEGKSMNQMELYIPTAFTPNDDGSNDAWIIKNIDKYPGCSVQVCTREGREVFISDGYQTPWNGKCEDHLLPIDKYKYTIRLNNQEATVLKGYVSIFR